MKLDQLYGGQRSQNRVFREYVERLKNLAKKPQILAEGKRVVVTTEIIDDDEDGPNKEAKEKFINQAQQIGQFGDPEWVKQLVNGMKQAGIHGVNGIAPESRPVTVAEVRELINLLIELINSK